MHPSHLAPDTAVAQHMQLITETAKFNADAKRSYTAARRREPYEYAKIVDLARTASEFMQSRAKNAAEAKSLAELSARAMASFASMPDADLRVMAQPTDGWNHGAVGAHVAKEKSCVIERHPALTEFYAMHAKMAVEQRDAELAAIARRSAAHDAGAAVRLLARLRTDGIALAVVGDKITAPACSLVSPSDLEEIKQHRAELLAMLRAEEVALRPLVLA